MSSFKQKVRQLVLHYYCSSKNVLKFTMFKLLTEQVNWAHSQWKANKHITLGATKLDSSVRQKPETIYYTSPPQYFLNEQC